MENKLFLSEKLWRGRAAMLFAALFAFIVFGCDAEEDDASDESALKFESPGPYAVGNANFELTDESRGRTLSVTVWYPAAPDAADAAEAGQPVEDFIIDEAQRDFYRDSLATSPDPGSSRTAYSALDAEPAEGIAPWPVAAFSHCMNCVKFAAFSIAERMASHGIAVIAPDHTGGTFFNSDMTNDSASLGEEFLATRAEDIMFLLDQALDAGSAGIPEKLRGKFDPERVGVFGHSYGGVTTGKVLMLDSRPKAGLAIAVPMESPLMPGVQVAGINVPLFFILAKQDDMIFEIGNEFIRENYDNANSPAWKAEVTDAGHMSFSNICGLGGGYLAGCDGDKYIDISTSRDIGMAYVTAFFSAFLKGDATGEAYIDMARPAEWVELSTK